ncbi:MAG: hypothetical protein M3009_03325 [Bombella apis]|uniref:hypothetical protein n=1 Tax=Bombella apis TaxID=1785988 RepID=UPI0023F2381E|nr:hypothetical protein [Bombella apis]MCT6819490.1 hypothetical protein [Bombella apis]
MANIFFCVVKSGQDQHSDREIIGWNRIEVPDGVEYIQMTGMDDAQWPPLQRDYSPKALEGGTNKIIPYTPPEPVIPLTVQAQNALSAARQTVYNEYASLNEPTPEEWVSYMKQLISISNGTDTTSTKLPAAPK